MSTDALVSGAATREKAAGWVQAAPILRFAVGTTVAWVCADLFGFPLPFLPPMLASILLTGDRPLSLRAVGLLLGGISFAGIVGLMVVWFFVDRPLSMVAIAFVVLLNTFHSYEKGTSRVLVTLLLLMTTLLPVIGIVAKPLVPIMALAVVAGGALAVLAHYLGWALVPGPIRAEARPTAKKEKAPPAPASPADRARTAWASTLIAFPVILMGLAFEATTALPFIVMVVLFAMDPTPEAGRSTARIRVPATLIGGGAAVVTFSILFVVETYVFFLLLMMLSGLWFGTRILSSRSSAEIYKSAFSTFILLMGQSTALGADTAEKFALRLVLVAAALIYVILMSSWVARLPRAEVAAA